MVDPQTGIGGLNHFLLPRSLADQGQSARYGSFAIPELRRQMGMAGAKVTHLRAKVYGGASVLGDNSEALAVGAQNIQVALSLLALFGIPIIDKAVGGFLGRRLVVRFPSFEVETNLLTKTMGTIKREA
jgi:chemotaxis receptor (MCP) glutamine deamidase CheD